MDSQEEIMSDEPRPEGQTSESATSESATAVAASPEGGSKLRQDVQITDAGPCKKHIKVTVNREDIDGRMKEHFSKLVHESNVTGFRPGKAPRRLIEKRFQKEVGDQVKNEVLMASLEQLGDDNDIAPLSPPDIDPSRIEIPASGPMVYEFDVEVRPEFDLPPYRGLKLKRPVKTYADGDVAEARRHVLAPYGQKVPKENGAVDLGDVITADVTFRDGSRIFGELKEATFQVEKQLAFKDGLARRFGAMMKGAKSGDKRVLDVELSSAAAEGQAGKTIQAEFDIKDVKTVRLPELTPEFLEESFGVSSAPALDEGIRVALQRHLEHQQRRSIRLQILQQLAGSTSWELPRDLLLRHSRKAMQRQIMEMKADGISDQEINQKIRLLEQDVVQNTALMLKEHFVMQKIADLEKIDVDDDDINDEIERIAEQDDESPRRIRARLEKEDMLDALAAEMIERKALDVILDSAEYEDVPLDPTEESEPLATVDSQAVPGEMQDPAAEAEKAAAEEKAADAEKAVSQEEK
jgi:trigger factor